MVPPKSGLWAICGNGLLPCSWLQSPFCPPSKGCQSLLYPHSKLQIYLLLPFRAPSLWQ